MTLETLFLTFSLCLLYTQLHNHFKKKIPTNSRIRLEPELSQKAITYLRSISLHAFPRAHNFTMNRTTRETCSKHLFLRLFMYIYESRIVQQKKNRHYYFVITR